MACGILVPRPGIKLTPSALEAWSLIQLGHQGSPSIVFSRLINVEVCVSVSAFLFIDDWYTNFVYPFVNWWTFCFFSLLAVMNNATQVFVWACVHFCQVGTWEWNGWHMITLCLVHLLATGPDSLDLSPGFAVSWLLQVCRWVTSIWASGTSSVDQKTNLPVYLSLARLPWGAGQDAVWGKISRKRGHFIIVGSVMTLLVIVPTLLILSSESYWSGEMNWNYCFQQRFFEGF